MGAVNNTKYVVWHHNHSLKFRAGWPEVYAYCTCSQTKLEGRLKHLPFFILPADDEDKIFYPCCLLIWTLWCIFLIRVERTLPDNNNFYETKAFTFISYVGGRRHWSQTLKERKIGTILKFTQERHCTAKNNESGAWYWDWRMVRTLNKHLLSEWTRK